MFLFHLRACYLREEKVIATQTLAQWMKYMNIVPPHPPAPHGNFVLDSVYESQDSDNPYCGEAHGFSETSSPSLSWRE